MSAETLEEKETPQKESGPKKLTPQEKQKEQHERIQRTVIACVMGIVTGIISYLVVGPEYIAGFNSYTFLGLLIMFAGIVVQRHVFMALRMNTSRLGKKDWLYQGFMTFAFWFIIWTFLLSGSI